MLYIPSLELDPEITCYNEMEEPCPWPYDPLFLVGAPLGQYHCPYCGAMTLAGVQHIDYGRCPGTENRHEWIANVCQRCGVDR